MSPTYLSPLDQLESPLTVVIALLAMICLAAGAWAWQKNRDRDK